MVASVALYALIASLAAPALGAVHERVAAVPRQWSLQETASDNTPLTLSIALVRQNLDQLESKLTERATPGHALYGQWLDKSDVEALFPTAKAQPVIDWLRSNGISQIHQDGSMVNFASTVGTVNKLLDTSFAWYQNGAARKLRTTQYSIPDSLKNNIDLIAPTVFFGNTQAYAAIPSVPREDHTPRTPPASELDSLCKPRVTPDCLKALYNFGDYEPSASSGARIGFGSFLNQSASYADVAQYQNYFNLTSQNFSVVLINGGVNDQNPATIQDGEADLDAELITGLAAPLPVTEFITGGSPPFVPNLDEPIAADNSNEPYLPYYEYLLSQPNSALPQVISNSYGDDEQTVPEYYAKRVCHLIGLMGLRGISVLESSGDTGVGAACQSNTGKKVPQFTPQFPGTCPWITSVGGTQSVAPEEAWVASSGGFSFYFSRPWYQAFAVENYLNNHISKETKQYYQQFTNFNGRGFPDVSSHSLTPDFEVVYNGKLSPSGGTSAACPTFSSVIARLNDARLRAGKPTLGFLNPWLYFLGFRGLNDITLGGSQGCNGYDLQTGQPVPGSVPIPYASWNATQGWDPVTGLGTANFEELLRLALAF